jgi:hypothetical protein
MSRCGARSSIAAGARTVEIVGRGVEPHPHAHQLAADEVGLRGLLHPDRDVGLAHRQVEHALLEHQVDVEIGVLLVELREARREPERAEGDGRGDAEMAEDLFLAVADPGGGGVEPLRHRAGRVEQELALFGENQAARVAVEERGVEALLERADLAGDGGLAEVQRVAGMGQAARVGDRVEDS